MTDTQMAQTLVRRGIRTATGLPYTAERVQGLRKRHAIPEYQPPRSESTEPVYTAPQAAKELGVSRFTVLRWLRDGLLVGDQVASRAPWRIPARAVRATGGRGLWVTLPRRPAGPLRGFFARRRLPPGQPSAPLTRPFTRHSLI